MPYVTILFISEKVEPAKFKQIIEACNFCVVKDKTKSFLYESQPSGEGIHIYSKTRNQAMKRGSYFHKKFGINYEVIWQK